MPKPQEAGFEESLASLEAIVDQLERGELPLEQALSLFQDGVDLAGRCQRQLEQVQRKVEILTRERGEIKPVPFETTSRHTEQRASGDAPTGCIEATPTQGRHQTIFSTRQAMTSLSKPAPLIADYFKQRSSEVDRWLDRLLPAETEPPPEIHRAMRYSIFAGGKRLRPILTIATGESLSADEQALPCRPPAPWR